MSSYRRTVGILLALVLVALSPAAPDARGADALADAKRKAAADLMRDGKTADAVALTLEVIRGDPDNYRDHLLLARAYDKQNKAQEAVDAYRRVLELLGPADDRTVRTEVDRRLKVLDAQSAKIQAVEDELLKKLDGLEREAVAAKDMRALQHVFALRGAVWNARGRKDGFGVDLPAVGEWFDSGATVKKGVKYRVRAAGYWTINGKVHCTADGSTAVPATQNGVYGMLLAAVESVGPPTRLGTDVTFVAPASGRIQFTTNVMTREERNNSTGRLYILVQPVSGGGGD